MNELMKIIKTVTNVKQKTCESCKLKKSCGDLPGFCMMPYYGLIASVVIMLTYFLVNMSL